MKALKWVLLFCLCVNFTTTNTLFAGSSPAAICLKLQSNNNFVVSTLNNTPLSNNNNCFTIEGVAPGKYLLKVSEFIAENGALKERIIYCNYITLPPGKMQLVYIDGSNVLHIIGERKIEAV